MHASTRELQPGTLVDQYQVRRLVGQGGMGEVYLARDTRLGRRVALKIIHGHHVDEQQAVERFLFEARATARFSHPHIVTIYGLGEWQGRPYLALEYLDGVTLRQRLGREAVPVPEAIRIAESVASALAEAHRHEVLHRDLKPENVLLAQGGRVLVVDFGLAKALSGGPGTGRPESDPARPALASPPPAGADGPAPGTSEAAPAETLTHDRFHTEGWGLRGTPAYMSPEQWREEEVTAAADVWALGVLLFELLAGRRPYEGTTPLSLAAAVSDRAEVDLAPLRDLPEPLVTLVAACLQKSPAGRPTAAEAAATLAQLESTHRTTGSSLENPFPGLRPFDERHASLFFGREAEIATLVERLRHETVLPLVGPSGAGKSSLVQAGLIPRLREQGRLLVLSLRPGSQPFAALAGRLLHPGPSRGRLTPVSLRRVSAEQPAVARIESLDPAAPPLDSVRTLERLAEAEPLAADLAEAPARLGLRLAQLAEAHGGRVLLLVDQLEELYTHGVTEDVRHRFLEALASVADDPADPVRVVLTLRDDYLGRLAEGEVGRALFSRVAVVRSPETACLAEVLRGPLARVGYGFEDPGLVDEMIAAVKGEPACLPILQFACHALWARRDDGRRQLTRAAYQQVGGVAGALAQHADGVIHGLGEPEVGLARTLLLRLVTPALTRRVVPRTELLAGLAPSAGGVLDRLVQERLLTVRRVPGRPTEIELAHESLIERWTRLGRWLEESREDLAFLDETRQAAERWDRHGRREADLWSGEALVDGLRARRRCGAAVPPLLDAFLVAGEVLGARHRRRRRLVTGGALALLGLVALSAGIAAWVFRDQRQAVSRARDRAEEARGAAERQRAEAERASARAALLRGDWIEARARLRETLEQADSPDSRSLWWRLWRSPIDWSRSLASTQTDVAFTADGRQVVSTSQEGTVQVFDVETDAETVLRGPEDALNAVATDPATPGRIAAGSASGEVWLWSAGQPGVRLETPRRGRAVWGLAFSPDGRSLAAATESGHVWLLDPGRRSVVWEVSLQDSGPLTRIRFTPDGRRLTVACADGTARVLEAASGLPLATWKVSPARLTDVRLSPDGRLAALTDRDGRCHVWSVPGGQRLHTLSGHVGRLNGAVFTPDARQLLTGGADQVVRRWDVTTGTSLGQLPLPGLIVWALDLSPGGERAAAAGVRGITVWHPGDWPTAPVQTSHSDAVISVAFDPLGKRLVTGSIDGTVRVWDRGPGRLLLTLAGHLSGVTGLALSPDGRRGAAGDWTDAVHLWDLDRGHRSDAIRPILGGVGPVAYLPDGSGLIVAAGWKALERWSLAPQRREWRAASLSTSIQNLAVSPDGRRAATADREGALRLWDVATGAPQAVWRVHEGEVYGLRFTPDGRTLVSCGMDQRVRLTAVDTGVPLGGWKLPAAGNLLDVSRDGRRLAVPLGSGETLLTTLDGTLLHRLKGASGPVNGAAFSPDGEQVATTHADGTVKLWDVATGRRAWTGAGLLRRPLAALTHRGLEPLVGASGGADPTFERHLRQHARLVEQSPEGTVTCVLTHAGALERWSGLPVTRLESTNASGAAQVVAWNGGCLARQADRIIESPVGLLPRDAAPPGLRHLYRQGHRLVLLGQSRLHGLGTAGERTTQEVPPTARTAAWVDDRWLVGLEDGRVELIEGRGVAPEVRFDHQIRSPITHLRPVPGNLLAVGHRNGLVVLLGRSDGREVDRLRLHGAIRSLAVTRSHVVLLSDLGDHRAIDLTPFRQSRCDLLRDVWRRVPVVWRSGRAVRQAPPADHACRRSGRP